MLKCWDADINNLNAALNLVPQAINKFTGSTIIDMGSAVNASHNHAIEVLSCKCNLKRYIDSHHGLIMLKPLHSTEGVQVDTIWQIGNEEVVSINKREATIIGFENIQPENKNETPASLFVEDNLTWVSMFDGVLHSKQTS